MAKASLTDLEIKRTKADPNKTIRLNDGGGLRLLVSPKDKRTWQYRYELPPGRENIYTIGDYRTVSLAAARSLRNDARELVKAGIHPKTARDNARRATIREQETTFESMAEAWIETRRHELTEGVVKQLEDVFSADIYPHIGSRPIAAIDHAEMLEVLRKIEARGALSIVKLARQRCSSVYTFAIAQGKATIDPTSSLEKALKAQVTRHHPHLTLSELPALVKKINEYVGYGLTQPCIKLAMMFFTRPSELRLAEWSEFDLEGEEFGYPVFNIPARRMKMRKAHIVPLSTQAVSVLRALKEETGNRRYLFPNLRRPSACMSITTINAVLYRMGYKGAFSAHGFRATASTILHESNRYNSDWIEVQLAHLDKSVRGVYNRAQYLPDRRQMIQEWSDRLEGMGLEIPDPTPEDAAPAPAKVKAKATRAPASRVAPLSDEAALIASIWD